MTKKHYLKLAKLIKDNASKNGRDYSPFHILSTFFNEKTLKEAITGSK